VRPVLGSRAATSILPVSGGIDPGVVGFVRAVGDRRSARAAVRRGVTAGGELQELVTTGARPHEVTAALLSELDRRPPGLLVLEDLHWADEATLDVIRLLARRVESVPALIVASFRDDELDYASQLRVVLGELPGRPLRASFGSPPV
jgi:hypothetical protein